MTLAHSPRTSRTKRTEALRQEALKIEQTGGSCALCEKSSIKAFKHWRIVENSFPHDRIADLHHMIVLNRHVTEAQLSGEEQAELVALKSGYLNEVYDGLWESTPKDKSIPSHHHLHLMVLRDVFINE